MYVIICQIEIRSTTLKVDDDENFEAKRSLSLSTFSFQKKLQLQRYSVIVSCFPFVCVIEYPNNTNV